MCAEYYGNIISQRKIKFMISFEEFKKVDLRVAKIITAEKVQKSENIVKLEIDLGTELGKRQILAGIQKYYTPEELVGRQIVVVINLEPKKIMGMESQGMLLAAGEIEPILLMPDKQVPPGSKIH